jgi:hypothetical protein
MSRYGAPCDEAAAAAAAAGRAHSGSGRRRIDQAVRAPVLGVAPARAADRVDHAGLRESHDRRADAHPLGRDAASHRRLSPGRRDRLAGGAAEARARPRLRRGPTRVPARPGAASVLRPAGARVAGTVRPRGSGRRARGARVSRRPHARPTPGRCRLSARTRLALRARHRLLHHASDAAPAAARASEHRSPHRRLPRGHRDLAAHLPRRRAPLLRPGGARRRLGHPTQEDTRCRSTSCCRRSRFRASRR